MLIWLPTGMVAGITKNMSAIWITACISSFLAGAFLAGYWNLEKEWSMEDSQAHTCENAE